MDVNTYAILSFSAKCPDMSGGGYEIIWIPLGLLPNSL